MATNTIDTAARGGERPRVVPKDEMLSRMRGEYLEMPGLRLTQKQATRLWGLDAQTCASLLESLTEANFLCVQRDGTYGRVSEAAPRAPRPRNSSHPTVKNSGRRD